MRLSKSQRLPNKQPKEDKHHNSSSELCGGGLSLNKWRNGKVQKSSLTISPAVSTQNPRTARERKHTSASGAPGHSPNKTGTTKSAQCHTVTGCKK